MYFKLFIFFFGWGVVELSFWGIFFYVFERISVVSFLFLFLFS